MLTAAQGVVVGIVLAGHSVAITGQAGTGKTFVIKEICRRLKGKKEVALLCTTGMGCLQFLEEGAQTVHRWAGLYDGRYGNCELEHLVENDDKYHQVRKNVNGTDVIIIDEVSMLSEKDFEQLELVCRTAKKNDKYFGGMQVITSGDFYQLPPVPNILYNDTGKFCFQSEIWNKVLCHKVNLTEVVRQTEPQLVRAVRETALGAVSQESDEFMKTLSGPLPSEMQPVHLFARNDDAALFNSDKLRDMPGESTVYRATKNNGPKKYLKKILAPQYLELKICSPVILLRNLGGRLVNGLSGIVEHLESDTITVRFPQIHQTYKISRCLFSVYNPRTRTNIAEREQFPLALGFALTMHKAQGMTLEAVVVHCKGIFQAGQMSVGIGRVRSSKGLRLEGYRAGLCTQHRSYVTEYYRMPSKNLSPNLECCRNLKIEEKHERIEEDIQDDYESDDSEFDERDLTEIESLDDDLQGDDQLPEYLDHNTLINMVKCRNPVTETQRKINTVCQTVDNTRLISFCLTQHRRLTTMIPDNCEEKTTVKTWSEALSMYHTYVNSTEFNRSVSNLFGFKTTEKPNMFIATALTFEILKKEIEKLCESVDIASNQSGLPRAEISEAGKAKVRHVGGMCVAKARHHYMNIVTSNLGNPSNKVIENVNSARKKVTILRCLEADIDDLDLELDSSLDETERKMNIRRGLTHITNSCFSFFLVLNHHVRKCLDIDALKTEKQDIFENVRSGISEDEDLQMIWAELFPPEESPSLVNDLYTNVTDRYMKVCNKQFLKETKDCLNVQKKKAHREEINKKKEEKKTVVSIAMKDILEDKSLEKESSHLKLKLNAMSNGQYLTGKEFSKTNLQKLCVAYDIKTQSGIKKEELAKELTKAILKEDRIPNASALSEDVSTENKIPEHSSAKRRRKSNAPGKRKGKGKGKGRSAEVKYYCGLCKEEYIEEEEWVQCFQCDKWFHKTCGEIDNEDDWEDIVNEITEWVCFRCLK